MRIRTLHTSVNLLTEPATYQRLKMTAKMEKISMSRVIRDDIKVRLDQIDKKNNSIMGG